MVAGNQALAVLLVLGMLAGLMWLLRRKGMAAWPVRRGGRQGYLRPVERVQLTATHSLHLVRFGDRALLIAVSPAGVHTLETSAWSELKPEVKP